MNNMPPIWSNADICLIMYDDVIESVLAQSAYTTQSLANEGFIHACNGRQVQEVIDKHYDRSQPMSIMIINEQKLSAPVKHEGPSLSMLSTEPFPHIYGPLNVDAVEHIIPLTEFI